VGGAIGKAIRGFKQAMNEPEKKPDAAEEKKIDSKAKE
jgi:Sec-independent protein translocase protein TatA